MTLTAACAAFATPAEFFASNCECSLDADDADHVALVEECLDQASDTLALATVQEVAGRCTARVRPVWLRAGHEVRSRFDTFGSERRYGGACVIPLRGPATTVLDVTIDGATIDPTTYKLIDGHYLLRKTGSWPTCNDLRLDATEAGTWTITYEWGNPIVFLARQASLELACELVKFSLGRPNRLPRGVTSANVQGVGVTARTLSETLRDAEEPIPAVARFLSVYAPDGAGITSAIWSPELEDDWNLVDAGDPISP